jgi:hypothetical protein
MIQIEFDPANRRLEAVIPIPPPDNHLHASGQYARYPKSAYKEWLGLVVAPLRDALGAWEPDTSNWWVVRGQLALHPHAGDSQNYLKATLDWLSGAYVSGGAVAHQGGLWNDDCRVALGLWVPVEVRSKEPRLTLVVKPWPQECWPQGWKARKVARLR